MIVNNYKEKNPTETVETIKLCLKKIEIETIEIWGQEITNAYSVIILIKGTRISSNGKGITKELALASGYGELIERLQGMLYFRISDGFKLYNIFNKQNYLLSDITSRLDVLKNSSTSWFDKVFAKETKQSIFKVLEDNNILEMSLCKFENLECADDICYIPYVLMDYYYGSNGMAAGNTFEEAVVQAISEIVERYVAKSIISKEYLYREKIRDITQVVSIQYPLIMEYINTLSQKGICLKLLDFSMNSTFPVIGVFYYDYENLKYFINFGSHPDILVAITRAITEFLQGRDIKKITDMTDVYIDFEEINTWENMNGIFRDGHGVFPINFFFETYNESRLPEIWKKKYKTNLEMLEFYKKRFAELKRKIYIKDLNVLGFPTYHVIIPGISEVSDVKNFEALNMVLRYDKMRELYVGLSKGKNDIQDIKVLIKYLESIKSNSYTLHNLLNMSLVIDSKEVLGIYKKEYILIIFNLFIEDYNKAYYYLMSYIKKIQKGECEGANISEMKMLAYILYLRKNNYKNEDILGVTKELKMNIEMIENVITYYMTEQVKDRLPRIICFDCEQCDYLGFCLFQNENNIIKKFIEYKFLND